MKEKSKRDSLAGTLFAGFLFLGMGAGFFTGYFLPGLFWGMGIGFIATGIIRFTLPDDDRTWSDQPPRRSATPPRTHNVASDEQDYEDYLFEEREE